MMSLLVTGCSQTSSSRMLYQTTSSIEGLIEDRSNYPSLLFVRPDVPEIGAYDRFIVGDVQILLTDSDAMKVPSRDLKYMANYLKVAIRYELSKAGYSVGAGYAKSALRMEFVISGLEIVGDRIHEDQIKVNERSEGAWLNSLRVSSLVVEGAFINAKSNRIDAVAVSETKPRRFEDARWWSTWEDIEESLDVWAVGIREAVDRTHSNRSFPE
jgi:hypothetical protein